MVKATAWPVTDVDRFVLHRLEAEGLEPVGDAERTTLLRRAYYDLIGLPPTVAQIDEFLNNDSADAFEEVVDELLQSKHFGERWGRHWLDVVRFAESSGGGRTALFPDAWRYRDYVVDAFNDDLPYDQFVKQQIAGDLMPAADWKQRRQQLTATAFLVLGPTNYELQDKETLEMDIVDEQLDTMGKAMLSMTIGCARCHDHKFDPIPTSDYYALAGIFKSTLSVIHENVSRWNEAELPLAPEVEAEMAVHEAKLAELQQASKLLKDELTSIGGSSGPMSIDPKLLPGLVIDDTQAELQGTWTKSTSIGGYFGANYIHASDPTSQATFAPKLPRRGSYEIRVTYTPSSNRSARVPIRVFHAQGESVIEVDQTASGSISKSIDSLGKFELDPAGQPRVVVSPAGAATGVVIADAVAFISKDALPDDAAPVLDTKRAARIAEIESQQKVLAQSIKQLQQKGPSRERAMAVTDSEQIQDIPISIRGLVHNPGEIVHRGVLQVATHGELPTIDDDFSGRMQLADWIADPHNPLTARVIVNRVWYWLYGTGLVRTVDNFGVMGEKPSHPELLDYLAATFVEDNWSIKKLVRRLVLSRTYRLSSRPKVELAKADPTNRLLGRMNRRRLDAESIRDSLLKVGGNLDLSFGGPNIKAGTKSEYGYKFSSARRSIYVPVFRNELSQILATFDFADPNTQVGSRTSSTTAPQALLLMNHPLVIEQTRDAATNLLSNNDMSVEQRIEHAFRQTLGRLPTERELIITTSYVGDSNAKDLWASFYQSLIQSLDFRYLR